MGVELKGKIMSNYSREVERQQSITTGIGFCVDSVLGQSPLMCHNSVVGNTASLLGRYRMLHFISVILSALVVGRLLMVSWGRRSY